MQFVAVVAVFVVACAVAEHHDKIEEASAVAVQGRAAQLEL